MPKPERRPTASPAALALAIGAVILVALGLAHRFGPPAPDAATAVAKLLDGDPDEHERRALLRFIAEHGVAEAIGRAHVGADQAARFAIYASSAATLLGDEEKVVDARAAWKVTDLRAIAPTRGIEQLALGEPALAAFYLGLIERDAGRGGDARAAFARARRAAILAELPLVQRLAEIALGG